MLSVAIQGYIGYIASVAQLNFIDEGAFRIFAIIAHTIAGISGLNHIIYYKFLLAHPKSPGLVLKAVVFNLEAISTLHFALAITDASVLDQNLVSSPLEDLAIALVWLNFIVDRIHLSIVFKKWWDVAEPADIVSKRAHGFRVISTSLAPFNVGLYLLNFIPLYAKIFCVKEEEVQVNQGPAEEGKKN